MLPAGSTSPVFLISICCTGRRFLFCLCQVMSCRRDYRCRKLYLRLTFLVAEMLSAGSTSPIFCISFRCAGRRVLFCLCQVMPCRRDYRCRKLYLCLAFCIAENLPAGSASPVFLISICCAGGVFLWSMYHISMCHCHGARGAYPTAIRSGDGNGDAAGAYGGYFTACIYRSNAGVAAFPVHIFTGSIVRLHRDCQGIAARFLQGQACLVQFHAGNRNNHRFINAQSKFPAVRAIGVGCRHGERTSPFCRRCAGNHAGTCVQTQAFRQGTAGDAPCDRSRTICQKSCAVRCLCSAVWQACCCNCRRILYTVTQAVLYPFVQRSAIHDHIVAIGVQACPIIQCQALTLANDQILL